MEKIGIDVHKIATQAVLRVLADRTPVRARFLVLGSASPELLRQASESLAGRIETIALGGFSLEEVHESSLDKHWRRGGFPRSFLARTESDSVAWRRNMIQTFLERDVPQLGVTIPATTLRRFWTMVAHYNDVAMNHLLGRGFRIEPPLNLFMANEPFGNFDRFISYGPPVNL